MEGDDREDSAGRGPARPPSRGRIGCAGVLVVLSAIPLTLLAIATLVGVGLNRQMSGEAAVAGALALVLLPIPGLVALLGRGLGGTAIGVAAWFWSLVSLLTVPLYFPGERTPAATAGIGYLAAGLSEELVEPATSSGLALIGLLGEEPHSLPRAAAVPPEREAAVVEAARALRAAARGASETAIPYDGEGQVMRVKAFFDGPRYGEEFRMIFDTGATYTTLDRESLAALEVDVPYDAPSATLNTANGRVEAPLVLVDAVWLDDAVVEWVTVAVCDPCAADGVVGLLGLNVTRQFQVSIDHAAHQIVLQGRGEAADRKLDVVQWLTLSSRLRRWRDGRVEVEVLGRNRAPIAVREAAAQVECPGGTFEVMLDHVEAEGESRVEVSLPRNTDCSEYTLDLAYARWEGDRFSR